MIAEYNKSHRAECIEIFLDTFSNPPFNYTWMKRDNIERYFADMELQPNFVGFVIKHGVRLTGMCLGTINDYYETVIYEIKEILIRRDLQKQGYGGKALTQIEEILKSAGVSGISLNTNTDTSAYHFYKKYGYEDAPKAVMMIKLL